MFCMRWRRVNGVFTVCCRSADVAFTTVIVLCVDSVPDVLGSGLGCKKKVKEAGFVVKSGWLVVEGAVAPRYHSSHPDFVAFQLRSGTVGSSCGSLHQIFTTCQDTVHVERVKMSVTTTTDNGSGEMEEKGVKDGQMENWGK